MHYLSGFFGEAKQCSVCVTEMRLISGIVLTISLTSWRRPTKALELVGCLTHEKLCRGQQWLMKSHSLICRHDSSVLTMELFQAISYCFYINIGHLHARLCSLMWPNDLEQEHCLRRKHQHSRQTIFVCAWLCASVIWQLTSLLLFKNSHSIRLGIHDSNYFTKESTNHTIWIFNQC